MQIFPHLLHTGVRRERLEERFRPRSSSFGDSSDSSCSCLLKLHQNPLSTMAQEYQQCLLFCILTLIHTYMFTYRCVNMLLIEYVCVDRRGLQLKIFQGWGDGSVCEVRAESLVPTCLCYFSVAVMKYGDRDSLQRFVWAFSCEV